MNTKGLIHIYCGDGKGKTTASLGLALRAACAGKRVYVLQFLKSDSSSETSINGVFGNMTLATVQKNVKFVFLMNEKEKQDNRNENHEVFNKVTASASAYDMLVLDEIIGCISIGQFDKTLLIDFLKNKPLGLEVVLTGRDPFPELIELADYVSEIKKIKHPYDKGVSARKGIEY